MCSIEVYFRRHIARRVQYALPVVGEPGLGILSEGACYVITLGDTASIASHGTSVSHLQSSVVVALQSVVDIYSIGRRAGGTG